mmetsp:Transcript_124186/g.277078  ORF Transcript_124186/g.277078 Transcript_124186/m.277078 type:complete len:729 (+) Transcript_124186:23-2209(+)
MLLTCEINSNGMWLTSKAVRDFARLLKMVGCTRSDIDIAISEASENDEVPYEPFISWVFSGRKPQTVDFGDLLGPGMMSGCVIADAAKRAITLQQLNRLAEHIRRRFEGGEVWAVKRKSSDCSEMIDVKIKSPGEVNLYDVKEHVILPSTRPRKCSMVELMASKEQPPLFFVSHFWGDSVLRFLACLKQHAQDQELEGEGACYWVCAHANNLHEMEMVSSELEENHSFRAMRSPTTRGIVLVIDDKAMVFSRVWCIYELFQSIIGEVNCALYTAREHIYENNHGQQTKRAAVGITNGLAASDGDAWDKRLRETHFPLALLDKGISFQVGECEASFSADRAHILGAFGEGHDAHRVHGIMAVAALRSALRESGSRRERYLRALKHGRVQKLWIDFTGEIDTLEALHAVMAALDGSTLVELAIRSDQLMVLPESFSQLRVLRMLILDGNRVTSLPETFGHLLALQHLNLDSNRLTALPDACGHLVALQKLELRDNRLVALPGPFGQLVALRELHLYGNDLTALPDSFDQLQALQKLDLRNNRIAKLPEAFGRLLALQKLFLGSNLLAALPETFGQLSGLQRLFLDRNRLTWLPATFGQLLALEELDLNGNKLAAIPETFGQLCALQVLDLHGNQLTELPQTFVKLLSLRILNLCDNMLRALPETFGQLLALRMLNLGGNLLTSLPRSFGQLSALQELDLNENPLSQPPIQVCKQGFRAIASYFALPFAGK